MPVCGAPPVPVEPAVPGLPPAPASDVPPLLMPALFTPPFVAPPGPVPPVLAPAALAPPLLLWPPLGTVPFPLVGAAPLDIVALPADLLTGPSSLPHAT